MRVQTLQTAGMDKSGTEQLYLCQIREAYKFTLYQIYNSTAM